jgi:type IV secretory pathway VirB2 component (pilin)
MIQGLGAAGDFFYGPFFKIGCLIALVVAGVVLLMDDGQMGRIAQFILRAICIIAFIAGAASFFTTPTSNCGAATG